MISKFVLYKLGTIQLIFHKSTPLSDVNYIINVNGPFYNVNNSIPFNSPNNCVLKYSKKDKSKYLFYIGSKYNTYKGPTRTDNYVIASNYYNWRFISTFELHLDKLFNMTLSNLQKYEFYIYFGMSKFAGVKYFNNESYKYNEGCDLDYVRIGNNPKLIEYYRYKITVRSLGGPNYTGQLEYAYSYFITAKQKVI